MKKKEKALSELRKFYTKSEREMVIFFKMRGIVDDGRLDNPVNQYKKNMKREYNANVKAIELTQMNTQLSI